MCQLLDGVAACHAIGIAHRDLKLENILIFGDEILKLCDFDLACFFNTSSNEDSARGGSAKYAAPELFDKKLLPDKYDDRAADAWSCGIIWFTLKTAKFPWEEATQESKLFCKHLLRTYKWPSASKLDVEMRRLLCVQIAMRLPLPTASGCAKYAVDASVVA